MCLQEFFPLLTELIGCEHAPPEVQVSEHAVHAGHSVSLCSHACPAVKESLGAPVCSVNRLAYLKCNLLLRCRSRCQSCSARG